MSGHRRLARRERYELAASAAMLVLAYLAGVVVLTGSIVWLQTRVGVLPAWLTVVGLAVVGAFVFVLVSRRFGRMTFLSEAEQSVIDQVDALVRVGVELEEAERLVREALLGGYRTHEAQRDMVSAVAGAHRERAGRGQGDNPKTAALPTGSYL